MTGIAVLKTVKGAQTQNVMKLKPHGSLSTVMKTRSNPSAIRTRKMPALGLSFGLLLSLSACSAPDAPVDSSETDDFAARINGNTPPAPATGGAGTVGGPQASYAPQAPTIAPPRENAAPGAYAPGTATDPESVTCNANKMGPFMGRLADEATRANIMSAAAGAADVRFIQAGSGYIAPDATNPRLNIMLDNQGIIRDARCG